MQPVTTERKPAHNRVDMTGRRIGRLTVIGPAPTKAGKAQWECRCECGATAVVSGDRMRGKIPTRSCGCQLSISRGLQRVPDADRFWPKVDKSGDCWEWAAARDGCGYGLFRRSDRVKRAHIVSWEMGNGPVPAGMEVCHGCDNPPCVRPDHLFIGTKSANQIDSSRKGRRSNQILSVADVEFIRSSRLTRSELAARFGVKPGTIGCVLRREIWGHVA